MFETSVVRAQAQAIRGRYTLLTASLTAHSVLIVGALAMSIASVDFPMIAPDEYSRAPVFVPVRIPPPLGDPNAGAKPKTPAAPTPQKPVQSQITAPPAIPENVTPAQSSVTGDTNPTTGTGTVEGPIGVPWGKEKSIGDLDGPPAPIDVPVQAEPEEKIYQPHEVKAPVLLHKVEPRYPPQFTKIGAGATVVVRCVIDRNGNVRDAEVIVPAMQPFNASVLDAVAQWRYKPATHGGRAVDSYLKLTVTFSVRR